MVKSRFGYRSQVPPLTTQKGQTKDLSFKDGPNTYKDNDDLKNTELAAVTDMRMVKIGRYKTRKGLDRFTVPIGEASNASVTSTTGASVAPINSTAAIAQRITASSNARLTRIDVRISSTTTSKGTLLVEIYTNNGNVPGDLIARSSIAASDISSSFSYVPSYFISAPAITSGSTYWIVIRAQNNKAGSYEVSTTTSASTALTSATNGAAWSASTFAVNVNMYAATSGGIKGIFKAYRPNGQIRTVFAHGDTVYEANANGTTTVIKSGMNPAATQYRFSMDQDTVRWTNGLEKPYKWDFSAVTQINECPVIPNNLMEHKGLLLYTNDADNTVVNYSNFAEYDTFTSTDFVYMPGPKSADGLRAMAKLNGIAYFFAKRNKRILLGSDNDTFQDDDAASQRGTFSQESLVYDANFIYYADDEGVWKFNGSDERNLAEPFLEEYRAIQNKEGIVLDIFNNRLYVFYPPAGSAINSECHVYNLLLDRYEGKDKNTYVGRSYGRSTQDDSFIQGSNLVGALYYSERSSNNYHNLGGQLDAAIYTAYSHFDTPGQLKRIPKHRPQLPSVSGDYNVQAGYDKDFAGNPQYIDMDVSGATVRYNTGLKFNSGIRYAGQRIIQPTNIQIPGTFRRIQRIYKHTAAREPFEFDSEVLTIETQRLI